ncbi:MAG: hypothetical protein AAGG38_12810 [Planctomycetota bacterium]
MLDDGDDDAYRRHPHVGRRGGGLWTRGMAEHPVTRRPMEAQRRAWLEVGRPPPAWANRFSHRRLNVEQCLAPERSGPNGRLS